MPLIAPFLNSMHKILVADDDALTRQLVDLKLRKEFSVTTAVDGNDALRLAEEVLPDLILLDLMMPGLDGLSVLKKLKLSPELRHIPVVMLTAKTNEQDIAAALDAGAAEYLVKPFNPGELMAVVRKLTKRPLTA
jgi:two-component system alkaline phosphatase synthesis response regulator PhoP